MVHALRMTHVGIVRGRKRDGDMPNLPCAHSTGKGSTLGLLTKCWWVGAGPALGRDCLCCLNWIPQRFLMVLGLLAHCGWKVQENEKSRKSGDMPNLPCARSTSKGSTLGPLTKCQRAGTGPTLGWDCLNCLNRKPQWFPMVLAHCGRKMRENVGKWEKQKSG